MRAAARPFMRFRRWWAGRAAAAGWNAPGRTPRPAGSPASGGPCGHRWRGRCAPRPAVVPGRQRGVHLGLRGPETLLVRHQQQAQTAAQPALGVGVELGPELFHRLPPHLQELVEVDPLGLQAQVEAALLGKVMLRHQLPGQRAGHPVPQAEDQPGLGQLPGLLAAPGVQPGDHLLAQLGLARRIGGALLCAVVLVDLQLDGQAADGPRLNGLDKAGVLPQGEGGRAKTPPRPGSPPPC